ncbi:MAG: hypothetical protein CMH65_13965 [Nevskiales bacterium]|nr:hypothetical protein [Nevskiales bacterium]
MQSLGEGVPLRQGGELSELMGESAPQSNRGRIAAWLRRELSGDDLRSQITLAIAVAAMVPMIIAVCVVVTYQGIQQRGAAANEVETSVRLGATALDEYLARHMLAIESLGRELEALELADAALDRALLDVHAVYDSFRSMALIDRQGMIVAATERTADGIVPAAERLGQAVWDRDYFRHALSDAGVQVSGIFVDDLVAAEPLVALSRSVNVAGEPAYVIKGSMDAASLVHRVQGQVVTPTICIAIVDGLRQIVGTTKPDRWPAMSPAPEQWFGPSGERAYVVRSVAGDWRVVGGLVQESTGWRNSQTTQLVALSTLLMGLIVAYLVGRWIAGRVNGPVTALNAELRQLDLETLSEAELSDPEPDWPTEIRVLRRKFLTLLVKMIRARDSQKELLAQSEELRFALHDEVMSRQAIIQEKTVALERANQTLERLARIDGLTGLCNRRVFDEELTRSWRTAVRDHQPLSVVLIDVDHFKAYNDHYGHMIGDDCLRAVGRVLEDSARRPGDLAARFGGEEFALLLPKTDLAGAIRIGQLVVDQVRELQIEHAKVPLGCVTISAGVAQVESDDHASPDKLLSAADAQLYVAKESGRNRCVG